MGLDVKRYTIERDGQALEIALCGAHQGVLEQYVSGSLDGEHAGVQDARERVWRDEELWLEFDQGAEGDT